MYEIHYRRNYDKPNDHTVVAKYITTLSRAAELRMVSGDLVVHADTGEIVTDPSWLFPWESEEFERGEPSYAGKAILWQASAQQS
jgi:hypothetical protein